MKLLFVLSLAVALAGCQTKTEVEGGSGSSTNASSTESPTTASSTDGSATPAAEVVDVQTRQPKDGEEVAVMDTSKGKIVIMFFTDKAPKTVENFKTLAKKGFYDFTKFHRTIENFMIQGGDPNTKKGDPETWGQGGPGYMIQDELNDVKHEPGILSMAHAGPNTGGSQFFIMTGEASHLNGVHTAFGKVVQGMDVVKEIEKTPLSGPNGQVDASKAVAIKSLKIEKWPVK